MSEIDQSALDAYQPAYDAAIKMITRDAPDLSQNAITWFAHCQGIRMSIAAATPHIRAALFDELIADARLLPSWPKENEDYQHTHFGEIGFIRKFRSFDEWLIDKKNKENTQP